MNIEEKVKSIDLFVKSGASKVFKALSSYLDKSKMSQKSNDEIELILLKAERLVYRSTFEIMSRVIEGYNNPDDTKELAKERTEALLSTIKTILDSDQEN